MCDAKPSRLPIDINALHSYVPFRDLTRVATPREDAGSEMGCGCENTNSTNRSKLNSPGGRCRFGSAGASEVGRLGNAPPARL